MKDTLISIAATIVSLLGFVTCLMLFGCLLWGLKALLGAF